MKKWLKTLLKQAEEQQITKDWLYTRSRDLGRRSKAVIYAIQREEFDFAEKEIKDLGKLFLETYKKIQKSDFVQDGNFLSALEEYLEGYYLLVILQHKTLEAFPLFPVSYEQSFSALADTSGELVRRATNIANNADIQELEYFRTFCDSLLSQMALLHLSGQLRQKYDEARRNLRRIEEIVFDTKRHVL